MGKMRKKHVAGKFKQKHPKNRHTKKQIVFDEDAREEYLTGFQKRKNERRKRAQEEIILKLKEQKKKIQERKKLNKKKELGALTEALDWKNLVPSETHDLVSHTVTVTDVTDVDFVGSGGFMLGSNTSNQNLEEESPNAAEEGKDSNKEDNMKQPSKTMVKKNKMQEVKLRKKLQQSVKSQKKKHRKQDSGKSKKKKRTK